MLKSFFYFSDTHIKAKISNTDLLKSPEQFNESKSGVFLISAELESVKGKLEMLNGLVLDVKATLENEIKLSLPLPVPYRTRQTGNGKMSHQICLGGK